MDETVIENAWMMHCWLALSLLGSMAVMGPAGLAVGVWLAAGQYWRLAFNWCLLFGAGMALVVATKIAFIGWGIGVHSLQFAGFSGHAMRAGAVLPVFLFVLLKEAGVFWRRAGVLAGCVVAILITMSRLVLGYHSTSEAVTGCLLGFMVAFAFIWLAGAGRDFAISRGLVALSFGSLLFTPRAEPVPTEQLITRAALFMSGHERPFSRYDWKVEQEHYLER
ncbi:MAG TPA: phosphatase PAP2 family protein [Janthinobacterium sp.]|jgi:membrane-associated phospholipid phosphatase|nr:phosphatase PAP2 family protein [Janthinobacterium sp.]